jgi:hypothetical protein
METKYRVIAQPQNMSPAEYDFYKSVERQGRVDLVPDSMKEKYQVPSMKMKLGQWAYEGMMALRMGYEYARISGVTEILGDHAETVEMALGIASSFLGVVSTTTFAMAMGPSPMGVVAAASIPLQVLGTYQMIEEGMKKQALRQYHVKRLKRLGIPLEFLDY